MVSAAQRIWMTEEEYLAFERASDEKHEYIGGEIFAMGGGSGPHSAIGSAFCRVLGVALLGRRCTVFNTEIAIYIPASRRFVYADASVVCGRILYKDNERDILLNPRVIVEVLSPSTEDYDRDDKFTHYQKVPSLAHYLLASQNEKLVEVSTRLEDGSWTSVKCGAGDKIALPAIECEIEVDQVYAGVFEAEVAYMAVD